MPESWSRRWPRRENGHLWRFDKERSDGGLPSGRVPGLRVGAADVV